MTKQPGDTSHLSRMLGIILPIALGIGLMAWIIRSAVVSDYYEPGVLALGVASFLCLLALKWRIGVIIRVSICFALLVFIVAAGIGLENFGRYRQRAGTITARAILVHVGDSLKQRSEATGDIPDCAFPCMADVLMKSGGFKVFNLQYAGGSGSVSYEGIPNRDPWNCRWSYKKLGSNAFVLRSSGPDRRFNTLDDITVTSAIPEIRPLEMLPRWEGWFKRQPPVERSRPEIVESCHGEDKNEKIID